MASTRSVAAAVCTVPDTLLLIYVATFTQFTGCQLAVAACYLGYLFILHVLTNAKAARHNNHTHQQGLTMQGILLLVALLLVGLREDMLTEPIATVLDPSGQSWFVKVHTDHSKSGAEAFLPLPVIREGPGKIMCHTHTLIKGPASHQGHQASRTAYCTSIALEFTCLARCTTAMLPTSAMQPTSILWVVLANCNKIMKLLAAHVY